MFLVDILRYGMIWLGMCWSKCRESQEECKRGITIRVAESARFCCIDHLLASFFVRLRFLYFTMNLTWMNFNRLSCQR